MVTKTQVASRKALVVSSKRRLCASLRDPSFGIAAEHGEVCANAFAIR